MKASRIRSEMHDNLDEQRHDYQRKMQIIEEIRQETELRQQQAQMQKKVKHKERAGKAKTEAELFKEQREAERQR